MLDMDSVHPHEGAILRA